MASRQCGGRPGRLDLGGDDVDQTVEDLVLAVDVVIERCGFDAELAREAAHGDGLDPLAVGDGEGTSLMQRFVDGDPGRVSLTVGVLLMMCAGLAVVGIGLLMYPVLKDVNPRLALWYPALRITECTVSAVCGIFLLSRLQVVPNHLLWVYLPTGVGGIILTYLLLVSRLVPRAIALLGLVGYALLTVGVPLDLLGLLDMSNGPGLLLVVPGGLFELVFVPIWLIPKGFGAPRTPDASQRPAGSASTSRQECAGRSPRSSRALSME